MPYRKRLERRRDAHARAAAAHERAVLVHEQAADQARSVGDGPREARERGMVIAQREGALLERGREAEAIAALAVLDVEPLPLQPL